MKYTLSQIETFECIVQLGSFHAASRQLGLTQPAISQRIRELEAALGAPLFFRNGPQIALTPEGRRLIGHATRLLSVGKEVDELFQPGGPLRGQLRLGVNDTFGRICLTDLLAQLDRRYPDLKTSVYIGDTGMVSRLLTERQLDAAIISQPQLDPHFYLQDLGRNELAWVAGAKLDIAPGTLTPADLAGYHLVVGPETSRLHATVSQWFAAAGVVPLRVSTCNSLMVTIEMILSGLTVGVVPVRVLADHLRTGQAVRLDVSPPVPSHQVSVCYQVRDYGAGVQELVALIRQLVQEYSLFRSD